MYFKAQILPVVKATKKELFRSFAMSLAMRDKQRMTEGNIQVGILTAKQLYCYVPHLYRGGAIIPGFGWTWERIDRNKHGLNFNYGNPMAYKPETWED